MEISEVLYRTADHIEKYGHCVGEAYQDPHNIAESPACIIGAAGVVFNGDTDPAIYAFNEYIGIPFGTPRWSDSHSQSEVVAALRAAALIESAKESPASHVVSTSPAHLRIVAEHYGLPVVVADGYELLTRYVPALGFALVYQARAAVSA